jgi:hypothetical protein
LQLARRPLMTGVPSSHAFFAASASLNVTCSLLSQNLARNDIGGRHAWWDSDLGSLRIRIPWIGR